MEQQNSFIRIVYFTNWNPMLYVCVCVWCAFYPFIYPLLMDSNSLKMNEFCGLRYIAVVGINDWMSDIYILCPKIKINWNAHQLHSYTQTVCVAMVVTSHGWVRVVRDLIQWKIQTDKVAFEQWQWGDGFNRSLVLSLFCSNQQLALWLPQNIA